MSSPSHKVAAPVQSRRGRRVWLLLGLATICTLPGIGLRLSGIHAGPVVQATLAGVALLAAAFVLSVAAQAAQTVMAGGLAIALLALITVLPEYAVDIVFAWNAAHDPTQAHFAVANMTGANRLLIGLGWSGTVLLAAVLSVRRGQRRRAREGVALPGAASLELALLLVATAYSLILPWRGSITLVDTAILGALFMGYLWLLKRGATGERAEDLVGPARSLAALPPRRLRLALVGLFALSALAILAVAEPFAEGLVEMGRQVRVDDFILVQIVAPLASEAPELIVVALFVMAGRAGTGLAALVSSKVNQWTLLVGSIPLVYSLALGRPQAFALDGRQSEELLLTAAQGLLAVVLVLDRRLGLFDGLLLLVLYCGQFLAPAPEARILFAWGYFVLAILAMLVSTSIRRGVAGLPRRFLKELQSLLATSGRRSSTG